VPLLKRFLVAFWIEDSGKSERAFLGVFTAHLVDLGFWQDKKMIEE